MGCVSSVNIYMCPECSNTTFLKDFHDGNIYCRKCGLVVVAPVNSPFVVDGFKVKKLDLIMVDVETYVL